VTLPDSCTATEEHEEDEKEETGAQIIKRKQRKEKA
jgi:hypothetical protein